MKVDLRKAKYGRMLMESKTRQLNASGRKYPKLEEQCVVFVKGMTRLNVRSIDDYLLIARDLTCPKSLDMYVSLNYVARPPGLLSVRLRINLLWSCTTH